MLQHRSPGSCPAQPPHLGPSCTVPSPELMQGTFEGVGQGGWDPKGAPTKTPALIPAHGPIRAIPGDAGLA